MKYIADLHIHSKYSRACSKELTPVKIAEWCAKKGIDIVSTGDFTHPGWFAELKENLEPAEAGFYKLKKSNNKTRFLVSTEISCIYKRHDKTRRVHLCIWMPTLESAEKFTKMLTDRGANVRSDGRPILGIDSEEVLKMAMESDTAAAVIPAHAWTPWFSVFGSQSGFDSLEECFGENSKYIFAIETGLSSDPPMNWRVSALDKISLISNSDAHSLEKLGREANVFSFDNGADYNKIIKAIREKNKNNFLYTIEFFPEEGKYHLDGHRDCKISFIPEETKKKNYLCPVCKKALTVGVLHRVDKLADRIQINKDNFIPYKNVVPLAEIIAECFEQGTKTKKVLEIYEKLLKNCGTEFEVLLEKPIEDIKKCAGEIVALAIEKMRRGDIFIKPGFDGEFGVVKIFKPEERKKLEQIKLL
ncbi:MAG: endonuclease Q family protein [Patescibacteria group bacterium]